MITVTVMLLTGAGIYCLVIYLAWWCDKCVDFVLDSQHVSLNPLLIWQVLSWTQKFVTQRSLTSICVVMLGFRWDFHILVNSIPSEHFDAYGFWPLATNRVQAVQLITMYFGTRTSSLLMGCSPLQTIFATRMFMFLFNFTVSWPWTLLSLVNASLSVINYVSLIRARSTCWFLQICKMHAFCFHWLVSLYHTHPYAQLVADK